MPTMPENLQPKAARISARHRRGKIRNRRASSGHRSGQQITPSHTFDHFIRHANGRPQVAQILVGRWGFSWAMAARAGRAGVQARGPVRHSVTFSPPWATGASVGSQGSPVAFASPPSLLTSPTRHPLKRSIKVLPSAP